MLPASAQAAKDYHARPAFWGVTTLPQDAKRSTSTKSIFTFYEAGTNIPYNANDYVRINSPLEEP